MAIAAEAKSIIPPLVEATYPKPSHAWYALGILTLVYVFSFIDRQIMNLMVGPIRRDLGISDTGLSLLTGFGFAVFYTLFGLPLARAADSGSRRGLIAAGFAIWSFFSAGCGLARTFAQLMVMRMGVGVGEASLTPAAYSLITDYFPPLKRSVAQGVYNAGISIGAGIATVLGALAVGFASSRGSWTVPVIGLIRPWQLVFFIVGPPGVLLSLLMFTVREPARHGVGTRFRSVPLRELFNFIKLNWRTVASHNIGSAMLAFSAYGTGAWLPTYFIRHFHWSAAQIGKVYGLQTAVFGTAGIIFGGWLADRLAKRGYEGACMRVALLGCLLWFPTGIAVFLVSDATWSAALIAPSTFFTVWFLSVAPAALMEFTPGRMRAQVGSIYVFIINLIGLGIGPTAVALFTDYVFRDDGMVGYSLLVTAVVAHVCAAVLFWAGLKPFIRSKHAMLGL